MKICIFGASSAHIDGVYVQKTEELAKKMALRGHSLVFGAGATGLMGAAARGTKCGGGFIHGVIPEFFREEGVEKIYNGCDELTYTATMAERKSRMEDEAEAFIIAPGGIGTLEEFYEVLTLKQLGRHSKAIAVFNPFGYYDKLLEMLKHCVHEDFMVSASLDLIKIFEDPDELLDYIENYSGKTADVQKLRYDLKDE